MPNTSDLSSEYIVHFVAPYRDPRLDATQLEEHIYLVTMTEDQANEIGESLKRMFDAGVIVHGFSVALAEAVRVTPMDLRRRITYFKQKGME